MAQVHPQDTVDVSQAARRGADYQCEFDLADVEPAIPSPDEARVTDAAGSLASGKQIADPPLSRLAAAVEDLRQVTATLSFGQDDHGRTVLSGRAEARLTLPCHRCLNDVECTIEAPLANIIWLGSEPPNELVRGEQDVVLTASTQMTYAALVEDDLLLALPQQACQADNCPDAPATGFGASSGDKGAAEASGIDQELPSDRQRPFADLKAMLDGEAEG